MADIEASTWSETAASNNSSAPAGMPEGMPPSGVNDWGRETMAAVKRAWNRDHATRNSAGSSNAYTVTYTSAPSAYVNGQEFAFRASFANTGSSTLNVSSLGAKTIQKQTSSGLANLASGDIFSGQHVHVAYDSTADVFVLLTQQSLSASGITGLLAVNNLSDVLSASTSRSNLGLGTAATHATGDFVLSTAAVAYTDTATQWTKRVAGATTVTLTDAATISWDMSQGNTFQVTIAGNRTMAAPTNTVNGDTGVLYIIQDGTGSRTMTWNSAFKWPSGAAPTLSTAASAVDMISYSVRSGNIYATLVGIGFA